MSIRTLPMTRLVRSEWIKIRSVRAVTGSLAAIFVGTLTATVAVFATVGQSDASGPDFEPVFSAFYALNFAQVAAINFGATALASEYANGSLGIWLAAVPRRSLLYGAKMSVIGALALLVGLITSFATFLVGQSFMGDHAIGLGHPGALRAAVGGGVHLALMALAAAGLTAVLRNAAVVLGLLIPVLLVASFVLGDVAGNAAQYLPFQAGQLVLHESPQGVMGPWAGLAVAAVWSAAALTAGWWCMKRRDA
ncbi:ABC transporter permease [Streptomyces sp. NPDC048590]|uniref:ABC transporter permease n=1 Tax=Streptomyces sp. NPDC048590 TaxID=3365574 RepID=UPI003723D422